MPSGSINVSGQQPTRPLQTSNLREEGRSACVSELRRADIDLPLLWGERSLRLDLALGGRIAANHTCWIARRALL